MKAAAVYPSKKSIGVITDFPEPAMLNPTSVKMRILTVGVCGTDREICSWEYGLPPEDSEYLVLGHEAVGEIIEVGPEVKGLQVGDIAIPMVRRPCTRPDCIPCRAGRQDFCQTGEFKERGIGGLHGFMTERIVDDAQYFSHVPKEIRDVAVLVEPLTIAEKAIIQALEVQNRLPWGIPGNSTSNGAGHKAVVLGAGPVGLLGAMTLKLAGFDVTVYSRDRAPNSSSQITEAIGAKYISALDSSIEQMAAAVGNIDVVYEAAGSPRLAFDVLPFLGTNGLFILTGVPGKHAPEPVETNLIMRNMVLKNQAMLGTVNAGHDAFNRAVSDLTQFHAKWPQAVQAILTRRYPIEQFAEPIHNAIGIKNVIEIAQ